VPRLYVGIVYGPQIYLTQYLLAVYDPSVLSDICMWLVLRSIHIHGDIILGWFTDMRVIRRMYKICLLTRNSLLCDIEARSDGSGAGQTAASNKSSLSGETRNGLQPCGL